MQTRNRFAGNKIRKQVSLNGTITKVLILAILRQILGIRSLLESIL